MSAAPAISSTAPYTTAHPATSQTAPRGTALHALAVVRILLGTVFMWAFVDKLIGLGFATPASKSWLAGGSPTAGYLGSVKGWFAGPFTTLAREPWVEWSFMLGLLLVGTALVLGVALRAAAVGGTLLMALMWLSSLPLKNHPVIDDHVIYAAVIIALAATGAGATWGLARTWERVLSAAPAPVRAILR